MQKLSCAKMICSFLLQMSKSKSRQKHRVAARSRQREERFERDRIRRAEAALVQQALQRERQPDADRAATTNPVRRQPLQLLRKSHDPYPAAA